MRRLAALGIVAGLALSGAPASADVLQCGQVVTQDTRLENDLDCNIGTGIVIGADNVTLDLGEHTVRGTGVFARVGVLSVGHTGDTVRNGTASGFGRGFQVDYGVVSRVQATGNGTGVLATGTVVSRSVLSDNGVGVVGGPLVDRNLVTDNVDGIVNSYGTVSRNTVTGNAVHGIALSGGDAASITGVVEHNTVERNGRDGIFSETPGAFIAKNRANGNTRLGMNAVVGTIDGGGNRASGNGDLRQCVGVYCK